MNKETLLMRYNDFEETKYLQEFISEEGRRKGTEALQEELKIDIDSFENVRKGGQEGVFSFDIIAEDSFNQEKIKEAEKIKNILNYWLRLYSVKETDSFYNQVEEFHGVVDEVNTNKDSFNVILFNVKEPEKKFYAEFGFDDIQYKSDRDLVKVGAQLVWNIGKETKLLLRDGYFRLGPQSSISKITFRRTKTLNKKQKQEAEKNAEYWTRFFEKCLED